MEKRAILAFILCGLVIFIHYYFVMPLIRPTPPAESEPSAEGKDTDGKPAKVAKSDEKQPAEVKPQPGSEADKTRVEPEPEPKPEPEPEPKPEPKPEPESTKEGPVFTSVVPEDQDPAAEFVVANKLVKTVWSPKRNGSCRRVTFEEFYTTIKREQPLTLLGDDFIAPPGGGDKRPPANMVLESETLGVALGRMTMKGEQVGDNVVFTGTILQRGKDYLQVTKTISLAPDSYDVNVEISFRNLSSDNITLDYVLRAVEGINVESGSSTEAAARVALLNPESNGTPAVQDAHSVGKMKTPDASWSVGDDKVVWAGLEERYFAALVVAQKPRRMKEVYVTPVKNIPLDATEVPDEPNNLLVRLTPHAVKLKAGKSAVHKYTLFVGPKEDDVLKAHAVLGFPQLLDYGMFGAISHVLLWLMKAFYSVTRNYGLAIILLTVLVRALLHPLTKKSQVAMHKMQKLRPRIQELQEKYKNDKQKLGQEQMKLFREAGANPFSGCLPILLQMPILIALFWGLRLTFDLRHAPFALWIQDLSQPDTVGHFPGGIPLFGGAAINVLPLLMVAAMFFQQRMAPKPDDPQAQQQQKFFAFFPFLMGFLFWGFPSGLTLYWFTSTVIGMGEQAYIKRHLAALPDVIPAKDNGKKKKPK